MLIFCLYFLILFPSIETFWFSIDNNRLFIECARSIIIKNHYWFLSELYSLLKSTNINSHQQIPIDHLHLILNHILIHCENAYQFYRKTEQNSKLNQFYQYVANRIKI